jgi:hypothetical protein
VARLYTVGSPGGLAVAHEALPLARAEAAGHEVVGGGVRARRRAVAGRTRAHERSARHVLLHGGGSKWIGKEPTKSHRRTKP